MSIRIRHALGLVGALAVALGIVFFAVQRKIEFAYGSIEAQDTERRVRQVANLLDRELQGMSLIALDYSRWDDTFDFVNGDAPGYVAISMTKEGQQNLALDLIAIYDLSGKARFAHVIDLETEDNIDGDLMVSAFVQANLDRLLAATVEAPFRGIVELPIGATLVVVTPITPTIAESAAPNGLLVMGRKLSETAVATFAKQLEQPMRMFDVTTAAGREASGPFVASLLADDGGFNLDDSSLDVIVGYKVIDDFAGEPVLAARIEAPRSIFNEGRRRPQL